MLSNRRICNIIIIRIKWEFYVQGNIHVFPEQYCHFLENKDVLFGSIITIYNDNIARIIIFKKVYASFQAR